MTHDFFPDLKISLNEIVSNQNKATVLWEYSGTHRNGVLFGAEASGKPVRVQGISILYMEDGKIKKEKGIVDNLSLILQLGVIDS